MESPSATPGTSRRTRSRATDAFYVTDAGHKVTDSQRQHAIEAALLDAIRQGAG